MPRSRAAVGLFLLLAAAFIVIGVLYQTGHLQLATSAEGKHFKHALVAYGCAVLSLVGASFARPQTI